MQIQDGTPRLANLPAARPAGTPPAASPGLQDVLDVAFLPSVDPVLRGAMSPGGLVTPRRTHVEGEVTNLQDPAFRRSLTFDKVFHPEDGINTLSGVVQGPAGDTSVRESQTLGPEGLQTSGMVGPDINGDPGPDNEKVRMGVTPDGKFLSEGQISRYSFLDETTFTADQGVIQQGYILADGGPAVPFARRVIPQADGGVEIQGRFGDLEEKGRVYQDPEGYLVIDRTIGSYQVKEKVRFEL